MAARLYDCAILVGKAAIVTNKLLALGIGGSVAAALCCFTPLLPLVLGGLGLTGLLSILYNDAVLLPMLGMFLILTGFALWRRNTLK